MVYSPNCLSRLAGALLSVSVVGTVGFASPALGETGAHSYGVLYTSSFAGYEIGSNQPLAKNVVQAQFTVPTVTCSNPLPGRAAFTVSAVHTLGSGEVTSAVVATCTAQGASPTYEATSSLVNDPLALAVSPGDVVMMRAVIDPFTTNNFRTSIENKTAGVTDNEGARASSGPVTTYIAEIGMDQLNGTQNAYPQFSRFSWVRATFDGQPLAGETTNRELMAERKGHVLIWASSLTPSGSSFSNLWQYGTY